jgi:hypothetical protein
MASTFSPSLKLELIGNGDQSGTWGTTTNTNLGTLLEQAITGVQAITMVNANVTLTNLNGASDEARNAVLVVGGTNSAIRSIIAPSVNKTYIVANNTVGGFAIIIKTSAGTGLTIPNGATQLVYCDGSEFYAAGFSNSGGTISGNLAITGTLAVTGATTLTTATATTPSSGDNTTKVATTAFVTTALQAIYPIGSIYTATVSTNPATLFGFGTWTAYGAGRVLIGNGGGFTAGDTGGSADAVVVSHNHTASSSSTSTVSDPSHTHSGTLGISYGGAYTGSSGFEEGRGNPDWQAGPVGTSSTGISVSTSTTTTNTGTGVSGTNANLQPYVVVYMWNRTA